jgi:YidC/Oxa1 family membrane protein insertase
MLVCTSWLSAGLNLMGAALAGATLVQQYILQIPSVRSALGIRQPPPSKPALAPTPTPVSSQDAVYEAPRQSTSVREKLSSNLNEMRQGISESLEKFTGQARGSATEEAEKRRKQMIKKLEDTRAQQERDHFEKKYKGKK